MRDKALLTLVGGAVLMSAVCAVSAAQLEPQGSSDGQAPEQAMVLFSVGDPRLASAIASAIERAKQEVEPLFPGYETPGTGSPFRTEPEPGSTSGFAIFAVARELRAEAALDAMERGALVGLFRWSTELGDLVLLEDYGIVKIYDLGFQVDRTWWPKRVPILILARKDTFEIDGIVLPWCVYVPAAHPASSPWPGWVPFPAPVPEPTQASALAGVGFTSDDTQTGTDGSLWDVLYVDWGDLRGFRERAAGPDPRGVTRLPDCPVSVPAAEELFPER